MLCKTLKRLIETNQIENLVQKLDIFLASNKLTVQEYEELQNMLKEV